jgi:1-acyl-sn-glycerol-3-phosphate acyltransferase
MFIFVLQLIISVACAVLYAIIGTYPAGILGVLAILGIFLLAFLAYFIVFMIVFCIFLVIVENIDKKAMWKHKIYMSFGVYIFKIFLRVRVKVSGIENIPSHQRFVIYSNHIENVDPIYIKLVLKKYPLSYLSKEELYRYPFLKHILSGSGCIPLQRGMSRKGMQAVLDAISQVKSGQPMGIFPEGTRSYSNQMIPFKAGAFKIAIKSEADIVPVCLYDMHGVFRKGRIGIHTGYIHFLPTIPYLEYGALESQELADMVQKLIQDQIDRFDRTLHPLSATEGS